MSSTLVLPVGGLQRWEEHVRAVQRVAGSPWLLAQSTGGSCELSCCPNLTVRVFCKDVLVPTLTTLFALATASLRESLPLEWGLPLEPPPSTLGSPGGRPGEGVSGVSREAPKGEGRRGGSKGRGRAPRGGGFKGEGGFEGRGGGGGASKGEALKGEGGFKRGLQSPLRDPFVGLKGLRSPLPLRPLNPSFPPSRPSLPLSSP